MNKMTNWLERTELLMSAQSMEQLRNAHVLIVGLGGIGSYAAEFIARGGVGRMTIIDGDDFDATNKNRQLTALDSTLGRNKAVVLAERIKEINPECQLTVIEEFVLPARVWEILQEDRPSYVMDCIDSVTPKLEWILACKRLKIKIISHMGAGGKTDPAQVRVANMEQLSGCKLGAHIKKRMKRKNAAATFFENDRRYALQEEFLWNSELHASPFWPHGCVRSLALFVESKGIN
jgi:tRNA A37 threonylcarbamoyladenosine dehydratase